MNRFIPLLLLILTPACAGVHHSAPKPEMTDEEFEDSLPDKYPLSYFMDDHAGLIQVVLKIESLVKNQKVKLGVAIQTHLDGSSISNHGKNIALSLTNKYSSMFLMAYHSMPAADARAWRENFNIVERSDLEKILREMKLGQTGALEAVSPQPGKLLGITHLLMIDIVYIPGEGFGETGKLVEVESAKVLSSYTQKIEPDTQKNGDGSIKTLTSYEFLARGNSARDLRDYTSAIDNYDKAIELDFGYAWAYFLRAVAYGKMGDNAHGIQDLQKACDLGLDDACASLDMLRKSLEKGNASDQKLLREFEGKVQKKTSRQSSRLAPSALDKQFLEASFAGNTAEVKRLLELGVNIEAKFDYGHTALTLAALSGQTETLKLLVDKGASVEAKDDNGQTALILAAHGGYAEALKMLLDSGADIEAKDNRGKTAIMNAEGQFEIVRLLRGRGAKIDSIGAQGLLNTKTNLDMQLLEAAQLDTPAIVKNLLVQGADIETVSSRGDTPLIGAAEKGKTDIVKLLLDKGAKIEGKSAATGMTALHAAAFAGRTDTVQLLLDRGANIEARDSIGNTALFYAFDARKYDTASLLTERGAKTGAIFKH